MPKSPVEVFWQHRQFACELRSTDEGWHVVLIGPGDQPVRSERVASGKVARQLAERWRTEDLEAHGSG